MLVSSKKAPKVSQWEVEHLNSIQVSVLLNVIRTKPVKNVYHLMEQRVDLNIVYGVKNYMSVYLLLISHSIVLLVNVVPYYGSIIIVQSDAWRFNNVLDAYLPPAVDGVLLVISLMDVAFACLEACLVPAMVIAQNLTSLMVQLIFQKKSKISFLIKT